MKSRSGRTVALAVPPALLMAGALVALAACSATPAEDEGSASSSILNLPGGPHSCPPSEILSCDYNEILRREYCWCEGAPPPAPVAVTVSGGDNGCITMSDGSVQCWPGSTHGDSGLDYVAPAYGALAAVPLPHAAISVAAGSNLGAGWGRNFACAVLSDHTVWCWGDNFHGSLGNGTTTAQATPVQVMETAAGVAVPLLATTVSTRANFVCALTTSGGVMCWGDNFFGELGNPSVPSTNQVPTPMSTVPVSVTLPAPAVSIAAGESHACAALSDGSVYCWGQNTGIGGPSYGPFINTGTLATGSSLAYVLSPQRVLNLPSATRVSAGFESTCAITTSGLWCWGELGLTIAPGTTSAVAVGAAPSALSVGDMGACEVLNGAAQCWGEDTLDQVGACATPNCHLGAPTPLFGAASGATAVSHGVFSSCAITTAGHVECIGYGNATPVTVY